MKVNFIVSFEYNSTLEYLKNRSYTLKKQFKYEKWAKSFENFWRKDEKIILNTIQEKSGIRWKYKELWCYLTPTVLGYSHPLTVKIMKNMNTTKKILIHELIHINFGKLFYKIKQMMPNNTYKLNYMAHVPLYLIYIDIIKKINPKDKKMFLNHELERWDYKKAVNKAKELYPLWTNSKKNIPQFTKDYIKKLI